MDWEAGTRLQDRVRAFDSDRHRKVRYYRAYADTRDANGHGTHVAGTLAGLRAGMSVAQAVAAGTSSNLGMAPDAKLAVYGAGQWRPQPACLQMQWCPRSSSAPSLPSMHCAGTHRPPQTSPPAPGG